MSSAAAESARVAAVFEHAVRDGATWHLLPERWWRSWCTFTGFSSDAGCQKDEPSGSRPATIDNSSILSTTPDLAAAGILRDDLQEGVDFVMLESRTALILEELYGVVGPSIQRQVVLRGLRKKPTVVIHPTFLKLIECDPSGAANPATAVVQSFAQSTLFSDVQELRHNLVEAAARQTQQQPEGQVDADMEEGVMSSAVQLPEVGASQEWLVRLWIKKTVEGGSAASSSECTALVAVSGVIDLTTGLPGGSNAADTSSPMEVEGETSAAVSSSSAATSSSASFEREWKNSGRPTKSLDDEDDAFDATSPTVRTSPLPKTEPLVDEWRLLTEEDLSESLEHHQLPQLSEVLVEQQYQRLQLVDGDVSELVSVWPRAAYHHAPSWSDVDVGDTADVLDTDEKWLEAKILAARTDNSALYVKYIGWVDTWNAWVPRTAARIALRYTHTTNPKARSEPLSFSSAGYTSTSSYRSSGYSYSSYSSSEEGKPIVPGAVGLKNLGNTCFMASSLQCLSHCAPLTDYFLDDEYLAHINRTNPLGWKGRVAEEYGSLLKELWSNKYLSVAPREFKSIIGEVQPRFEGYAQHDSSELLSFLLDGLHEDLNRVQVKPPTGAVDSNGRPDEIVAKEAWATYQMRNQSVIVDLMAGQFKSTVVCPIPTCHKVSITFDPFQMLSVPLPIASDTVVVVHLVYADATRPLVQVGAVVSKSARLSELKAAVCAAVGDIQNPRRLVLGDVFSSKIYRFWEEDGLVSDIKSNDVVYAYECPEIDAYTAKDSPAGGFYPIAINFQTREATTYYSYSSHRDTPCALPRAICLPKKIQVTVRDIIDALHAKVAPHLRSGDPQQQTTAPELTREELESAYEVILADDRGENCGHHESTGWSADKCSGCVLREYSRIKSADAAAEAASKAKADAISGRVHSSSSVITNHNNNAWEAFAEGGDDDLKSMGDESESSSPVIVPDQAASPSIEDGVKSEEDETMLVNASPDAAASITTTEGFVQVEMADGAAVAAASVPIAPMPDLDVPFEIKLSRPYTYSEVVPRCSFVVRILHATAPQAPRAVLAEDSVASLEDDSPQPASTPSPVEGEALPAAAPTAPVAFVPWFSKDSADREVKHASVDTVAKDDVESVSLGDCVKAFAKEETLSEEDPWYCSDCKEHRQATKKFDLWKLPSILVIQMKRFSYSRYSRDKISTPVNFPIVGLDLSEHTANPEHAGELYDLCAVSNHMGGLGGGHYTAYVRNHTDGCWYLHDDSSVSRVRRVADIRSSSAYVLFYQRRARGAAVQTEEEIEEVMRRFQADQPKPTATRYSWNTSTNDLD